MITAVEWLENELKKSMMPSWLNELFKQAKELEKQQIIEAFEHFSFNLEDGEQYYTQTFKSE